MVCSWKQLLIYLIKNLNRNQIHKYSFMTVLILNSLEFKSFFNKKKKYIYRISTE